MRSIIRLSLSGARRTGIISGSLSRPKTPLNSRISRLSRATSWPTPNATLAPASTGSAVDHWNTEHPHVHVIVRGRTDDGKDLVISRDYIREGMRARAQQLLTLELGPRSDREIRHSLETQVGAERWTRLDRTLARDAAAHGSVVDLRPEPGQSQENFHGIKIGRMRKLEALGLARPLGPAQWSLSENAEDVLRELGERNDIIKRIHRGLTEKGWERGASDFVLHGEAEPHP